ncbi:MAG: FKBP-type peptidyl-prolyl cis-trans isomerase [Lewinellaceae bacterium]|nr:FKBP-type peptidyl-prolyl cis-trans isomerase [Saprospiraceae bacterium]MCB9331497.1 FKBP-type peptidyl-prolyl cis-trans isomerase [Lewinellaceae bacterium]
MRQIIVFPALILLGLLASCRTAIITPHGNRFINHTKSGGVKPKPGESVLVNTYVYIKDSLLMSSRANSGGPREFELVTEDKLPKRVPAIYDAILLMGEGDSATIYEPIDTLIRKFVPEGLEGAKNVRYELVLVKIISQAEKENEKAAIAAKLEFVQENIPTVLQEYLAGKLADKLIKLDSGLNILLEEKGSGAPVKAGEMVHAHYCGCLTSGEMFDNSYQRGEPLTFSAGVGQMIQGFDEGVMQLNHGGKAYFFIPSNLGYGENETGPIPPNSDLVFYVEIL